MAVTIPDIPLRGMVRDRPGKRLEAGRATNLINTWRESGELRARPGLASFADTPAVVPVQNLFTAEFADESRSLLRLDENDPYNYNAGSEAWLEIAASNPLFTGSATEPFGLAMVFNNLIASNGVNGDGVFRWPGTGDFVDLNTEANGAGTDEVLALHPAFRYVAAFAGRVIGAFTSATNGANTVIGSAIGSVTDWTSVNGAFVTIRNEHPSPITQLTSDENTLIVWKERAIITGVETGDDDAPIFWTLARTEGIGNIAPRSVVAHGGFFAALSHEGFYQFIGGQPQFIDIDIKRDFFRRLNRTALRQVHSMVMPEYGKIVWFIPEGDDTYPRHAWVFDTFGGGWERWELGTEVTASARAFASTGNVIDAYGGEGAIADITGGNALIDTGVISGTIIDTLGTGVSEPLYLLGDSAGVTRRIDFGADDDDGASFALTWESPDVRWEGIQDTETGETVGPRDVVTLDEVRLEYNHSGSDASVEVSVSTNGGRSWSVLQTKTISATSDDYASVSFWGRASGNQIRVRLRMSQVMGFPRFRNLTLFGQPQGERR